MDQVTPGAETPAPKRRGRPTKSAAGHPAPTESQPSPSRPKKVEAPTELVMDLYAPGMGLLHRAGLGGLACSLKWIERAAQRGNSAETALPGAPWSDGKPPWTIDPRTVTLRWGRPDAAGEFLRRLFALSFQIRDGLIYLPGQYDNVPPNMAVRADLQLGLTLTFLQHGRVRGLAKTPTTVQHDPEGSGLPGVTVEFKACTGFKHQNGWEELVNEKGQLRTEPLSIDGPLSPGTVVRHQAYSADTKADDTADKLLPLYFAMVGCLALPVNRGVGVLLIPEVEHLQDFVTVRPRLTPGTVKDCTVAGAADGALRLQIRMKAALRSREMSEAYNISGCHATTFMRKPWASQQKSRVSAITVSGDHPGRLERYETALELLPPKVLVKTEEEATSRGKKRVVTSIKQVAYRADSVVRPLVADNLALNRPWYAGFARLMTTRDPVNKEPLRNKVYFERKGLHAMTKETNMLDNPDEALIVQAVHEAIRTRLNQIRVETDGVKPLSQATKNRWEKFQERLRIDLAGAKTVEQVRFTLCDLFSRAGRNPTLRNDWRKVLPLLSRNWRLVRDLGLLALASYAGRDRNDHHVNADEPTQTITETSQD